MIPVSFETMVDSIDVGQWFSLDLEEEPEIDDPKATAIYSVRIGDVQFKIRAPYFEQGPIEVLEASRVKDEPRTKWPDLRNLRPQVVRMRRRRSVLETDKPEADDTDDEPGDESA
jgi:hypothetical protein